MQENKQLTTFELLNNLNLSDKIDQKMGLNYLSWANAWAILKKYYPTSEYKIYTREVPYEQTVTETSKDETTGIETVVTTTKKGSNEIPYFTDGKTTYVKVGVIIEGVEYVEYYPIMDLKNHAVSINMVNMVDVNKALQRAFVKACARHGLGLYVYAGEDLPDADKPKPVDYEAIKKEVNALKFTAGEKSVIEMVGEIGDTIKMFGNAKGDPRGNVVNNYMAELVKTYNVAKISESEEATYKLYNFIQKIK